VRGQGTTTFSDCGFLPCRYHRHVSRRKLRSLDWCSPVRRSEDRGSRNYLFGIANTIFVLIWTDMTPGNDIAYVLFLLGIGSGSLLEGISLLSTGTLEKRFQNEAASSYFFLRQVGASLGVSAAAVLIDQMMTMHSSRLPDTANRLDPVVQRVLRDFTSLIAARAHGTSVPAPGIMSYFKDWLSRKHDCWLSSKSAFAWRWPL
jgi:hypothetical protein